MPTLNKFYLVAKKITLHKSCYELLARLVKRHKNIYIYNREGTNSISFWDKPTDQFVELDSMKYLLNSEDSLFISGNLIPSLTSDHYLNERWEVAKLENFQDFNNIQLEVHEYEKTKEV